MQKNKNLHSCILVWERSGILREQPEEDNEKTFLKSIVEIFVNEIVTISNLREAIMIKIVFFLHYLLGDLAGDILACLLRDLLGGLLGHLLKNSKMTKHFQVKLK